MQAWIVPVFLTRVLSHFGLELRPRSRKPDEHHGLKGSLLSTPEMRGAEAGLIPRSVHRRAAERKSRAHASKWPLWSRSIPAAARDREGLIGLLRG